MGKIIIIVGIRGAGKSSLMGKIAPRFKNFKIMNFGEVMVHIAKDKGYIPDANHDNMRILSSALQNKIRSEAWELIANQKEDVMVDTHAFVEHTGLFLPGMPVAELTKLKGLCGLFCIDAPNDTLRSRAERDKKRIRAGMDDFALNNYRNANIAALAYLSTKFGIPLYLIYNEDGKLDAAADILEKHMLDAFNTAKQVA